MAGKLTHYSVLALLIAAGALWTRPSLAQGPPADPFEQARPTQGFPAQGPTAQGSAAQGFPTQAASAQFPPQQPTPRQINLDGRVDHLIATVGGQPVFLSDVVVQVNETIRENELEKKMPPEELEKVRAALVHRALSPIVSRKIVMTAIYRKVPKENIELIRGRIDKHFEESEIKRLITDLKVKSRGELAIKMERLGTPLPKYKSEYIETMFAMEWVKQTVKAEKEITHDEALIYYNQNIAEFEFPAKARWEQLTVNINANMPKEQALAKLSFMGNSVFGGVPFADVAKKYSDDANKDEGGYHDWTSKGSLASDVLDEAIFQRLNPGEMSRIIEERDAVHIVRVIERRAAGRVPFTEAQLSIKKTLQKEFKAVKQKEFVEKLRSDTVVWTIFDNAVPQTATQPQPPQR